MKVWIEEIWLKQSQAECKSLDLLSFDSFAAHLINGVKAQLWESNSDILPISAGCISKCQPMDSLNKPFKAVLRRCWVKYFASVVEGFHHANSVTRFKLPVLTRQHMIDWVKEKFDYLVQDQEMVKRFKFAALAHCIKIKCGMVSSSNITWERHCTMQRPMVL